MRSIWQRLYGRISLLYLVLSVALCLLCAWVTVRHFEVFVGAVNQRLDRGLAGHLAERVEEVAADTTYAQAIDEVAGNVRALRPAVQLYALDASGRVQASSVAPSYVERRRVDLAPIRSLLRGTSAPVWGEDPASTDDQKVFSVARLERAGAEAGYLYVILNGCSLDAIASTLQNTYVWRTLLTNLLLALGAASLVGLLLFRVTTRRFRALTDTVRAFKNGAYDERAHADQEDEIGRLGQAFNEMADTIAAQMEALRRTDEERRRLVAQVSHDFRTPLTSIQGHAEKLLAAETEADAAPTPPHPPRVPEASPPGSTPPGDGAPPATSRRKRRLETILQNTERLERLADRLHELSRLDAQGMELDETTFSIAELVHDLVVKFRPRAERHGLSLRVDVDRAPPAVRGDIGLIERLLSNLVENALLYTPDGGTVEVRVREDGGAVLLDVIDTGVGIPGEEVPLVTQRFYQVESGEADTGQAAVPAGEGSGLGLAIADEIATAHDGELRIESEVGKGTAVMVILPIAGSHS
jgi:signal transduction histidine kinase